MRSDLALRHEMFGRLVQFEVDARQIDGAVFVAQAFTHPRVEGC